MQNKDIQIIAQNCNTAAATIVAGMHIDDVAAACDAYNTLYEMVTATVFGKITELTVEEHMPGGQVVPAPAPATGPQAEGATVMQFPVPQPAAGEVPLPQPFNPATQVHQAAPPAVPQATNPAHADWMSVLTEQGHSWYDNRYNKKSPKGPDFRHKTQMDGQYKKGLWMRDCPPELAQQINALPAF